MMVAREVVKRQADLDSLGPAVWNRRTSPPEEFVSQTLASALNQDYEAADQAPAVSGLAAKLDQ